MRWFKMWVVGGGGRILPGTSPFSRGNGATAVPRVDSGSERCCGRTHLRQGKKEIVYEDHVVRRRESAGARRMHAHIKSSGTPGERQRSLSACRPGSREALPGGGCTHNGLIHSRGGRGNSPSDWCKSDKCPFRVGRTHRTVVTHWRWKIKMGHEIKSSSHQLVLLIAPNLNLIYQHLRMINYFHQFHYLFKCHFSGP